MICRGIRGATTAEENSSEAILEATRQLLEAMVQKNDIYPDDVASAIFSVTPDLDATFPAQAARQIGWTEVPLLDTVEIPVPNAPQRCIRVLIHWNTSQPPEGIWHIYQREAVQLRPDYVEAAVASSQVKARIAGNGHPDDDAKTGPTQHPLAALAAARQAVVAYQGEPGANSQEAIFRALGSQTTTLPCKTFQEIFEAVETGRATMGLLPVENSRAGSINQAYDLLLAHDLRVIGEVKSRVRHCLLIPPGANPAEIKRVRSHPQALAQCERYLADRGWEAIPDQDTAGAARALAESREPGTAVIASALAGKIYGLEVLATGIEDSPQNTTHFFVLGVEDVPAGALNKTSIVFTTSHTPGALYNALGEFASRGINLTKLESRPRRDRAWHYVFYADLDGHAQDSGLSRALRGLLGRCPFVKILGSYPAAPEVVGE